MFLDSVCYAAFPEILCSTGKKKKTTENSEIAQDYSFREVKDSPC